MHLILCTPFVPYRCLQTAFSETKIFPIMAKDIPQYDVYFYVHIFEVSIKET